MKKSSFTVKILGILGCVCFSLGMCMTLVEEWSMMRQGIVVGVIGMLILLTDLLYWRKITGKARFHMDRKTALTVVLIVAGALLLGIGMSLVMVTQIMVSGIAIGLLGIIILLMLIPTGADLTKG